MKYTSKNNKLILVFATAALGLLTSCQQQPIGTPEKDGLSGNELVPVTLSASIAQTKATYAETTEKNLQPNWEVNDKVIGFDGNNVKYEFTVSKVSADGSATLTGNAPANCTLHLIYLYGAASSSIGADGKLTVAYDGQMGGKTIPAVMLADGEVAFGSGNFHFHNAGAVIGINATKGVPGGSTISKITVYGDNLSAATVGLTDGKLALTAGGSTGESISTGDGFSATVSSDGKGTLVGNPVLFAVPAGAKVSAVSVEVESISYSYNLSTPATLVANQYSYVTGKTFKKKIIEVSFSASCIKPTPESPQPEFVGGEVIKVSNGTDTQDCTVTVEDGVAGITTSLTGPLTMVYPAAAWSDTEPYFKVPAVQDGTFASANICKAEIAAGATSATFENQTAVFCITPGAGASTKYVEVITAGPEIANSVPEGSEYDTMHKIHVASTSAEAVYVSILVPSGLKFRDLSFADGSNMKTLKDDTDAIAVNSLYTVTNENWSRPYVDLQMTVGGKTRTYKWATMNVGATTPEDYGLYFAWGETTGHSLIEDWKSKWSEEDWEYTDVFNPNNYSFDWLTAPFNNSSSSYDETYFNAHKSEWLTGDNILKLEYDAANVNWGGSWRMPAIEEFGALRAITKAWDYDKKGYTFGVSSAQIFLPATGRGVDTELKYVGDDGRYWSSSTDTVYPDCAFHFYFEDGLAYGCGEYRFHGYSVRPVSE